MSSSATPITSACVGPTRRPGKSGGHPFLALVCFCVSILGPFGALIQWRSYQLALQAAKSNAWHGTGLPDQNAGQMVALSLHRAHWCLAESIACMAGTGLLLGLGFWFTRTGQPPQYAPIDWRTTPRPTHTITVRPTRWQLILYVPFLLLTSGLMLAIFAQRGFTFNAVYLLGLNAILHGVICFWLHRARRMGVSEFNASGTVRRDGRRFAWDDFQGVNVRISINPRSGRRYIWRAELVFDDGQRAWVIPQHVKNVDEVFDYLALLPPPRVADGVSTIATPAPEIAPPNPPVRPPSIQVAKPVINQQVDHPMSLAADAKMIGAWAETLCTENETLPEDMALFLGFSGTLDRQGNRYEVQPAPEGTNGVWLGLAGEDFERLEAELASIIPVDALERYLGRSEALAGGSLVYRLTKPKAPNACVVMVEIADDRVHRLEMRRVPAASALPRAGFPMELDKFLCWAKDLAANGALVELKLLEAGGRVAELAKIPELTKVQRLEMRSQGITDADIQALAASPYVGGLRGLSVERNEIGQAGIEALAAATPTTLKSLVAVGLDLNRVENPVDQLEFYDETNQERVPTETGRALEAKFGRIKWLHPPE